MPHLSLKQAKQLCLVLIFAGILGRFYDITAPWKIHDHYNYGGAVTTAYAECMKKTPLSVSKGIPHLDCDKSELTYYRNHPPTILFAYWGWTSIFGSAEWSYRSMILLFSVLNIFLIGLCARAARPESELLPYTAAASQAIFLGGLYFGTHPDFIGEFTVTFTLLSALFALRNQWTLACLIAIVAGITSWPGYIMFGALFASALVRKEQRLKVFVFGAIGFAIAILSIAWLRQTFDIASFLQAKVVKQDYVKQDQAGWLMPLFFVMNFIASMSRLLSPLLFAFGLFELVRRSGRPVLEFNHAILKRKTIVDPFAHAVWLTGGTGFLYALIGHEYVMVHVFLYLLLTPAFALLLGSFIERALHSQFESTRSDKKFFVVAAFIIAAIYPYGIFKTNAIHDAITSVILIFSAIAAMVWIWKGSLTSRRTAALFAIAFIGNFSQMTNYRNEPDTERNFCEKARAEYEATGQPVKTYESPSNTKELLYCRGIPIEYQNK